MAAVCIDRLQEYLASLNRQRFDWARCNCFVFCADWVTIATGRDPAARWRNAFCDKPSALRLLRREGGPRGLARKAMLSAGCPATRAPQRGDVALVMAPIGKRGGRILNRPTGAICVADGMFAILTVDLGLVVAPRAAEMAWSVHG